MLLIRQLQNDQQAVVICSLNQDTAMPNGWPLPMDAGLPCPGNRMVLVLMVLALMVLARPHANRRYFRIVPCSLSDAKAVELARAANQKKDD